MSDATETETADIAQDDTSTDASQNKDTSTSEATDWEAEAKKWEKRAKDNKNAAVKLEQLERDAMTAQEKAVAEAKAAGMAEAAKTYGSKLAAAKLEAAAASKGVDLSSIGKYLKADMFVGEDGEVDSAAIKAAVADFAKSMGGPKRSGGDFGGGNGAGQITREQLNSMSPSEIAKAHAEGKLNHLM
jgi:hypothetical protein